MRQKSVHFLPSVANIIVTARVFLILESLMKRVDDEENVNLNDERDNQVNNENYFVIHFDAWVKLVVFICELDVCEKCEGETNSHNKAGDDDDHAEDSKPLNSPMIALKIKFITRNLSPTIKIEILRIQLP